MLERKKKNPKSSLIRGATLTGWPNPTHVCVGLHKHFNYLD